MTREEIMLIAEEAGFRLASYSDTVDERNLYPHELKRFASLVAAAEREACAQEADAHASIEWIAQRIAEAIRARGQA